MGESIISTCMSLLGKTKENIKARKDLAELVIPISVKKLDSRLIYDSWGLGPHRLSCVIYEG
jgi:hypothetical protein